MTTKKEMRVHDSNKRKRDASKNTKGSKKGHALSSLPTKGPKTKKMKPSRAPKLDADEPTLQDKSKDAPSKKNSKESRLTAKETVESRKKKRKPHYILEKELASLWEKMRRHDVSKEERSKLVSEALLKMKGKVIEIAGSHVSARVLQTCVKYCSQAERDAVFEALRPHLLTISQKKYAVHLVKKLLECASKKDLEWFISSLHGHVASLLRHTVGSAVIDYAFHLANGAQKQRLLVEMYSTELQLFKDLTLAKSGRLVDIISNLGLQKSSVLQHMTTVIQPILEKGLVDHSIVHKALVEFCTIADRSSAADLIQQLLSLLVPKSADLEEDQQYTVPDVPEKRKVRKKDFKEPLLFRMIRTRDGLKLCILCVKHSSAKERKKLAKSMKGHVRKLVLDQYGSLLLCSVLSVVDDTKLVAKVVMPELQMSLKEILLDKNGRRPVLQLLHPRCPSYFAPEDLSLLDLNVPSISGQSNEAAASPEASHNYAGTNEEVSVNVSKKLVVESKKDPYTRRFELLVDSGLAERLIQMCVENAGEMLQSNFGKDVIFEVASGGTDNILQSLADRISDLHKAVASLAALPKSNESEDEHVLENFHSSRLIRKLILDCPPFATKLWEAALKNRCNIWAQGHSVKVVSAFMESSDSMVRDMAKAELQCLIDSGHLKAPENKAN